MSAATSEYLQLKREPLNSEKQIKSSLSNDEASGDGTQAGDDERGTRGGGGERAG